MAGEDDTTPTKYTDGPFRGLPKEDLDKTEYSGDRANVMGAIDTTNKIQAEISESVADFIDVVKKELKELQKELERARAAVVTQNKNLIEIVKKMPSSDERKGLRKWAWPEGEDL